MKINKKISLVDLINVLPKPKLPKDFNWKEAYYKAIKKKYKL